jgi:stage II sporulation protein M
MFLIEYIKKYKVTYISVIAIFLVGIIIGIFVTFKIPLDEKSDIKNFLSDSIEELKNANLDRKEIFKESLFGNLKLILIIWILGCSVIASFTIYILMLYKGFIFGYIITIIISTLGSNSGIKFLIPTVIFKNFIFLPIVFLLATSGIRMYKGIIKKQINIKMELIRHTIVMGCAFTFSIIISCVEAYFSPILLQFL